MTAADLVRATHEDSDGVGYCRGCGTTIGEPHHADCDLLGNAIGKVIRWPVKHVRLRLQIDDYQKNLDVSIVSDTAEMGFHAMENAIGEAYQHLPSRDVPADPDNPSAGTERMAFVELTDADSNRRIVEDADLRGEEWLKDLVAGIEIVSHEEPAR